MVTQIELGGIVVDLEFKDIKNIHLSVYPPKGKVRISAPNHMDIERIRIYAISKLGWIQEQQKKFLNQDRETPREYSERESHYLWGNRYLLQVIESSQASGITLEQKRMFLKTRQGADVQKKQSIMENWYRSQVKQAAIPLIAKWEDSMGVKSGQLFIQRMKTRWGSCNGCSRSIRLNTELAKKPRECLEYIIIHELAHLIEPTHNTQFITLMDKYLPNWKVIRDELNRAPLGHVNWEY